MNENNLKLSSFVKYIYKYGVYFIFLVLIIFFATKNSNFYSTSNILILLQQAAPMGIAVIGMTYVMMVGGIDISAGQNMYLSAVVVGVVVEKLLSANIIKSGGALNTLIIYGLAILVGATVGSINGVLVARFNIVPFIASLATMNIARGIGLIISNSKVIFTDGVGLGHISQSVGFLPIVVIILIVLTIIFDYVLRRMPFGRNIMAIGNDKVAAARIGIKVRKDVFIAYLICGILAAVAGVMSAGQVGAVAVNFAYGNEFIVISAAVLGGTSLFGGKGSVLPGAFIGIILVTTIVNGMAMLNADPYIYTIVRGVIIFIAVMVDSVNYKGELR